MSDYHLHLVPHDVEASTVGPLPRRIEQHVEHAVASGLPEIGFTEHLYRCFESEKVLGPFWASEPRVDLAAQVEAVMAVDRTISLERYVEAVIDARAQGLPVKLGLEVDFFPETIERVAAFLEPYPWDYLIGSIHWIGGWAVDDDRVAFEFERRGVERAWDEYFELEVQLAASGAVDVLGHVDVVKKHGFRPENEPLHWYDAVVEAAVASGTAVEVSSQGLRNAAKEVYPSAAFLRRFMAAGVDITLASDGHTPEHTGHGHLEVVAAARAAGYETYLHFDGRKPEPVPLPRRSNGSR